MYLESLESGYTRIQVWDTEDFMYLGSLESGYTTDTSARHRVLKETNWFVWDGWSDHASWTKMEKFVEDTPTLERYARCVDAHRRGNDQNSFSKK